MRQGVAFKAAGADYALAFTTRAMAEYEEEFGESFLAITDRFEENGGKGLRVTFLVKLLEIGLRVNHPDVTADEAFDIVDDLGVIGVSEKIGDAISRAFPDAKGKDDAGARAGNVKPAKAA